METNPLAEVFGYPITNESKDAKRSRRLRLCPFNNNVPNCTKDKAQNPLGVCTIYEGEKMAITCPVRFRERWIIAEDMANFLFPPGTTWTSLTEVRLKDKNGLSAGNIDLVLVSYDDRGKLLDFGALEVQGVYISGNVRNPFEAYMECKSPTFTWPHENLYPRPDYLSSSRKRLIPQLIYKGGILSSWKKKIGVALHEDFFKTLPTLPVVDKADANIVWFVYKLKTDTKNNRYTLSKKKTVYTEFKDALSRISNPQPGPIEDFIKELQIKLDEKIEHLIPPDTNGITLSEVLQK